ncbi:titin homolog [Drosophila ficusphila]|uniref:titin homolog n=1 Tax=Drosophila ficusphila TaxID=30025 RepID=UPI001C894DA2|nr:titin homolog [Drosophila ficusphila]
MEGKLKVCIVGAEGWGTAIAAAVSNNVLKGDFDSRVHIYVNDEMIDDKVLSEVINSHHENVKYLPGIKLSNNLLAANDLLEAAQNADILIFSSAQENIKSYCKILAGNIKESAFAVSMSKGLMRESDGQITLVSQEISERLGIPCYSMMSTHSAMEMAQEEQCEVTLGCSDEGHARLLTDVLQTENCSVISVDDVDGVELCGTLTDVVALGAGFVDGLRLGENSQVAAVHLVIKEMMRFIETFFPSAEMSTFYDNCGVANTVSASFVNKNATFAKSFITSGKTIEEIEAGLPNGRKILGPMVVAQVNALLEKEIMQAEFPLFTAIHLICQSEASPELMLEALRNHPDLSDASISNLLAHESAQGERNVDKVLDPVADTLPKLRNALDRVLSEAGNESFKHLKVTEDWTEVNDYDVEGAGQRQADALGSPHETEEMPRRLSVQAAQIQDDIRDGKVQVAFKMDIDEGDRHLRLLLEEDRETFADKIQSGISSRLVAGREDDSGWSRRDSFTASELRTGKGGQTGISSNDSLDVLDLSSESEPLRSEMKPISDEEKQNAFKFSGITSLKSKIEDQEDLNLKAQENLIRSIRQTIQALGDKDKMDNLIAESQMENEVFELKSLTQDDDLQPKSEMERETFQLKSELEKDGFELQNHLEQETSFVKKELEEELYHLKSQIEESGLEQKSMLEAEDFQLKNQIDEETSEMKTPMEEELFKIKKKMEKGISQLENQAEHSSFVGHHAEDEEPLQELKAEKEDHIGSETENLEALMFKDYEEHSAADKQIEMLIEHENDFDLDGEPALTKLQDENADLDEEPVIGKKDRTYTKENIELQELLEWNHKPSFSAELEESTAWEDDARLPVEHEDRLRDVDIHQEAEPLQVRAEKKEKMAKNFGEQEPYKSLDEDKLRYYGENKGEGTGNHEWDWLMNNENIGMDTVEGQRELPASERNEILSKSDKEKLENLDHQLKEALHHDLEMEMLSASRGDESKEGLSQEELDTEAAKKLTEQPHNPTPSQIPALPAQLPLPRKQSHTREGTPQFQNQPRSDPPPSPQTKPPPPNEHQNQRTKLEPMADFEQPEASASDREPPAKSVGKKVSKIEPLAKDVSTAEPTEQLKTKKESPSAKQSTPAAVSAENRQTSLKSAQYIDPVAKKASETEPPVKPVAKSGKQQAGSSKPPGDAAPADSQQSSRKTSKHRQNNENRKSQLEKEIQKVGLMRKGQDRRVTYSGRNPFKVEPDLGSNSPMDTTLERDKAAETHGVGHQRRKVVVTPPFHPPINPRMRIPRPPFDGRDHEFHTMTVRPTSEHIAPAVKWPPMPTNLKRNHTSLVASIQAKHFSALQSQVPPVPQSFLKMPSGVPRTPTFTKILCALQLGMLASYLARFKKD